MVLLGYAQAVKDTCVQSYTTLCLWYTSIVYPLQMCSWRVIYACGRSAALASALSHTTCHVQQLTAGVGFCCCPGLGPVW